MVKVSLQDVLKVSNIFDASFSSQKNKQSQYKRIRIYPFNDKLKIEYVFKNNSQFKSIDLNELDKVLLDCLTLFKQCIVKTYDVEYHFLINKKGLSKCVRSTKKNNDLKTTHNKVKSYLIPDHKPCDFLYEIGIMDREGNVKPSGYKKFKQINRFLEMVDDLFKKDNKLIYHIVDFGCGKSYLTFAIFHYFTKILNSKVKITGIDIKEDVIAHCNKVATKLKFDSLKFVHGFIHDFKTDDPIDFVITLHACDTATDDAILFSINNDAEKMMFVPCCQHELNKQLRNDLSEPLLKHGIFKDRMCSLVTDSMRTQILELAGYKTQSMEFIDLEHTAKNIMIRCTKTSRNNEQSKLLLQKYKAFKNQWGIDPYLENKVKERYGFMEN